MAGIPIIAVVVLIILSVRIVVEYKRGVVFRLGKYNRTLKPGLRYQYQQSILCYDPICSNNNEKYCWTI